LILKRMSNFRKKITIFWCRIEKKPCPYVVNSGD
jgi:hypothetical protein